MCIRDRNAGAVAGAAHAPVGDPHHVAHARLHQLLGDRQHPPFGHARPTLGTGILEHDHVVGRDLEILTIDLARHVVVVLEGERGAAMLEEALIGGRRLHHAAARREVASEHRGRALCIDRVSGRADHIRQMDAGFCDVLAERLPGHRHAGEIELVGERVHQRAQTTGIEEILHQELAGGAQVGDHRYLAREGVEIIGRQRHAGAAGHGDEMDDGVGRAAHRHVHLDRVVERRGRQDPVRGQILPHHVDDAAAGDTAHARVSRIRRGNRGSARQGETEGFGDRHHRRRRPHDHAGAEGARDAALDLVPLLVRDQAGALLGPILPRIGAGAEIFATPVAAQHRAGRHIDRRDAHADGAHHQARRGLVAAAHQHRTVDRVAAQEFLCLHREEVAIEHGRRLDEGLGQRHRRQLDREAAGLQHAALDVLGARTQMRVAGVDLAPGVDDADHRPAGPVLGVVAELAQPRTMAERA